MNRTVLGVIQTVCSRESLSYKEIKEKFPDSIAKHGTKFQKEMYVLERESDISPDLKTPRARFFLDSPIFLKKDKETILVSNQWNSDNFEAFCQRAKEVFDIDIQKI